MKELFFAFIESPTRETYLPIFAAVVASEKYDPYSSDLDGIANLVDRGQFDAARKLVFESFPNLLISPQVHLLMAACAKGLGDAQAAEVEQMMASACAEGIASSGDGSKQRPYLVLRTSDEYDVMSYLGKKFTRQSLIHGDDGRSFDCMTCSDGDVWFDITTMFKSMRL